MSKQILFIQGGGEDGYEADQALVNSLQQRLGDEYKIQYPRLKSDESAPDFGWVQQIKQLISDSEDGIFIVAHSLGASMLLKCLSEHAVEKNIRAGFLVSTPYWSGDEDWQKGLILAKDFANKLPADLPFYFYHTKDDDVAPFPQLDYYKKKMSGASFREIPTGGHQLNNDLSIVARDVESLG